MAFDGIATACLAAELSRELADARISRIAQTEKDELLITVRRDRNAGPGQIRLYMSANPSLPLCYLTEDNAQSPATAPAFCMLLRKYLMGGKILSVIQPSLERVLRFDIEHRNEMGDLTVHTLVIELMGKHSNIILTERTEDGERIVDAIRHVSSMMSSVREVLPGRAYFIPETKGKTDPLCENREGFLAKMRDEAFAGRNAAGFVQGAYQGISGVVAADLASAAGDRVPAAELPEAEQEALWARFHALMDRVRDRDFEPYIYYRENAAGGREPFEYSAVPLGTMTDMQAEAYPSISRLLLVYYGEKNAAGRMKQRSADLRHLVSTLLERAVHKYDLQQKQMEDTEKKEKDRLYGELILANAWSIPAGAAECEVEDYYTGRKVKIRLDPRLSASENAVRYYDRYNKRKRTKEALEEFLEEGRQQIDELRNIQTSLEFAQNEADLSEIRLELEQQGYLKKAAAGPRAHGKDRRGAKGRTPASEPLHYISSDGFDLYVGKNNLQNDQVSFHVASGSDLWFHANDIPGSHVIAKTGGRAMEELPDRLFEEAASLAAYYSAGRNQSKVEIDYLERKNLKKPSGAKPGFVVYYTNYSIVAKPDISMLQQA